MWLKWLPWRYLVRALAARQGFIDPISLLSALERFSSPSEVSEPIELLRAGVAFHARGLINTKAIQHNLDWVWPYWVERQFNPHDVSFIPRAFSITHVNLTHRNWTAAGLPRCDAYALVDPRGLVTPHFDGWSLDFWVIDATGRTLLPSRADAAEQGLDTREQLLITTRVRAEGIEILSRVRVEERGGEPWLCIEVRAESRVAASCIVAIRPYNPEGISFIRKIEMDEQGVWCVNGSDRLHLSPQSGRALFSSYREGDVAHRLALAGAGRGSVACEVGLATAAAVYSIEPEGTARVSIEAPLYEQIPRGRGLPRAWSGATAPQCRLAVPDARFVELYDQAAAVVRLLTPHDAFPGSFTYKRFWFRDAAFMLHALLCIGGVDEVRAALLRFFPRQLNNGYFRSQEGEWDSNGQVLWMVRRFYELSGEPELSAERLEAISRGARWIAAKRSRKAPPECAGLLPPGFSAEHFGPNDYYYWDDLWSAAGLRAAAWLLRRGGQERASERAAAEAEDLLRCTTASMDRARSLNIYEAIPAAPYRRMDAGAIGVLAAIYPLQLLPPAHPGLRATEQFLHERCLLRGAFFQDMVHSGVNAYLTLHLAQALLAAGDARFESLVSAVRGLASPCGQWPEAIHPLTGGGCMGDGQHGWAAAEWLMMMRSMFLREEGETLILASGVFPDWLEHPGELEFGPTLTRWGAVSVQLRSTREEVAVSWQGAWRGPAPEIEVRVPGYPAVRQPGAAAVRLPRRQNG